MDSLYQTLKQLNISYSAEQTLAELTTFKVGGAADLVLYPESIEQCRHIIELADRLGKNLVFLGNGSNILGSDRGCRDWILKTDRLSKLELDNNGILRAGAGVKLVKVSSFAAKNGRSGFEFAHGIPGSIGGAVFMNAGAYDGAMEQVVLRTHYLDRAGNLRILEAKDHCYGYRKSFFMDHPELLIVETELQLRLGDIEKINEKINDFQARRKEKQPLEFPSAGSTFKRPEGYFAGKLIQDSGLKGFSIGGAQVSEKHAGFVINYDNASGDDIRRLIAHIQKEVYARFGVELECEVRRLGED